MTDSNRNDKSSRKPVYLNYYTNLDFDDVLIQLPGIIEKAELEASQKMEPTINEEEKL